MIRARISLAVIALAGTILLPASAHALSPTDNAHQIPGIAIPGGTVSGTAGGDVYDLVFRIDVPAHRVLFTQLTGDPGTDFDLYLFDSTATDIYGTTGEVGSSTGPTSSEFINYSTLTGGTFYIDIASGGSAAGQFSLVTRVLDDTTPPTVGLLLDGGSPVTNDPVVTATILGDDAISGVADMQFSSDGVTWGDWQPYHSVAFQTYSTDGPKDLWVRLRDRLGNVSPPAGASIIVDTVPPIVVGRFPPPGGNTNGLRPTLTVTFNEPIQSASWTADGLVLRDAQGTAIPGSLSYDDATSTGTYVPSNDLIPGGVYSASLGPVVDKAGNQTPPLGTWILHSIAQPVMKLTAPSAVVTGSTSMSLSGTVSGSPGVQVELEESVAGAAWTPVTTIALRTSGTFSQPVPVSRNTGFRLHALPSATSNEVVGTTISVAVRPVLTLVGFTPSATRTSLVARTLTVVGQASPSENATPMTMTAYWYDPSKRAYVAVTTVKRAPVAGKATFNWRPMKAGSWYLRVTSAASADYAAGTSSTYRWQIS
jgi:hypothetical protein